MNNLKLFVNELAKLGLDVSPSKFDESYYDQRIKFNCSSLSPDDQQTLILVILFNSSKLHLSVCNSLSIILRPYELNVNWDDMSEDQVRRLANEYFSKYVNLYERTQAFMTDI